MLLFFAGYINPATGDLFITGRAKDTIVLSNGENIEPNPIEDALLGCKLIDQVVLRGQDKKQLSAIVVLNPRELATAGFIDEKEGERLQQLVDQINEPLCSVGQYKSVCYKTLESGSIGFISIPYRCIQVCCLYVNQPVVCMFEI